ncbi:hypothetical protein ABZ924_06335 [Streptomyces sp. NPDC046876]|uniref:hypothetical protein n=1 Tax=Streptomyces sp. NPDC046876 TaxID=3155616 RepID=UPI0033DBF36D
MGVFDRLFRRKAAAATDEVAAEGVTAEKQSEESGVAADGAAGTGAEPAAAGAPAAEAVEIPKQQSAEAAADSEAGESART